MTAAKAFAARLAFHILRGMTTSNRSDAQLHPFDSSSAPGSNPLLLLENLGKIYAGSRTPAIEGVDLTIRAGEVVGLVGLNGAGKTTTIRIAAGLIHPSTGRALVAGHDVGREKVLASPHLGLVPEYPNFDPMAKALPLLRYLAGFYGFRGREAESRGKELLRVVGLSDSESQRIRTFSYGMKKRLALATALLGDPEVLLLDEVLNGLDPQGIAFVREAIRSWREEGKAILLSSHLLNEVQSLANRIAVIHEGHCLRVLQADDLAVSRSRVLRISITDIDDRAVSYLRTRGEVEQDGNNVRVSHLTAEPEEISFELARMGFHVRSLTMDSPTLEDFFFDLIGNIPEGGLENYKDDRSSAG